MRMKLTCGACVVALLTTVPVSAQVGNGVRLPATVQPLLGVTNNGGLVLPLADISLPLASTSLVSPLLAGPLGSSPSLPNQLLSPVLAVGSPVVFTALPGLDAASGSVLAPVMGPANPLVGSALNTAIVAVQDVNGPGPGAPAGSSAQR